MLVKTMQVGQIGTNCYLLGDEAAKVCAIVDPGDDGEAIAQMVRASGLEPKMILLTHGHFDHTGGISGLRALWPDLVVYLHKGDYTDGRKSSYRLGTTPNVLFYGEGDTVLLGGLTIEVLHTPGHSPGSVTLKVGDVLFTGDTLFQGSMGRTDLQGGSYEEIMASLKRLGQLPGDYNVCPGHMGLSTLDAERASNYYLRQAITV